MYPNLFQIYGPIYLNCYGLAITIGIITFSYLLGKNEFIKNIMSKEQLKDVIFFSCLSGIIGGRILWAIEDWNSIESFSEIFKLWEPGYSFLGSLITIIAFLYWYLKKFDIPFLPFADNCSIYAPLLHSISRIGCFLAGCCCGIKTNLFFGIIYTHPDVLVPNNLKFIKIHPVQIYSSILLMLSFCFFYFYVQHKFKNQGQIFSLYLMFAGFERFITDFLRADREFWGSSFFKMFSIHQWISIIIFLFGFLLFTYLYNRYNSLKFIKNI